MKTFCFKLYNHPRNRHLHSEIDQYSQVYNHCIALHKRYYRLFGKFLSANDLKSHITKLKKRQKYAHWNQLGSQAIQDVVERIDRAYKLFFSNLKTGRKTAPPSFKKRIKYKSFTLKQAGYQLLQENYIRIGKYICRYFKSRDRDIEGNVKTLTVKRDALGYLYIIITTDAETKIENVSTTGQSVGYDFGLKTFLTASDGKDVKSPLFFNSGLKTIRKANKKLSTKKRGSHNRQRARKNLAFKHRQIANQRNDFHWKLADRLTDEYDSLFFEDLNLKGMQSLWGKKINDLGFYAFLQKVKYYAGIKGKHVVFIDRFYPSSKTCSDCDFIFKELELRQRVWTCLQCGTTHNRERNASINIKRVGASTLRLGDVRPPSQVAVAT